MRRLAFATCLAVIMLVSSGAAQAQSQAAEPSAYRPTIERALQEFDLGHFEEARREFTKAHELFPNARTLRGLGFSEFELRNYVDCVSRLEGALASEVRPLNDAQRHETRALLARARDYVGEIKLELSPANTQVLLDGMPLPMEALHPLLLNVGMHELEFRAEGRVHERRSLNIAGGEVETVVVRLVALVPGPDSSASRGTEVPAHQGDQHVESKPIYKRWWLWTLVGVVVAGAAAGTVLALQSKETEYKSAPSEYTPTGVALRPLWQH